jgi:cytochrome P450
MPFSFGKRSCIGANLAMVQSTLTLALLAQRVTFHEVSTCLDTPLAWGDLAKVGQM